MRLALYCTGCGQDRVERVACQAAEEASPHAMIRFQVPDLRLDRTSPSPTLLLRSRQVVRAAADNVNAS